MLWAAPEGESRQHRPFFVHWAPLMRSSGPLIQPATALPSRVAKDRCFPTPGFCTILPLARSLREGASLMTTTAVPPRQTSLLLGIFFMCAACTLFPIMNGIVQVLSRDYPSEQIIWARTTGHLLIVLALIVPRYGLVVLQSRKPGVQISRSLLLLASTTFFFFSVKDVPLAKASSISFMSPFFVTLLALPMLGEQIGWKRLAAVTVGFLGVLVVIRPGSEVFQPAALGIVASAFCYAIYHILTRQVAGLDRPATSVMYSGLFGAPGDVLRHSLLLGALQ